ncbi:MAG: SNF2 helicase associated domain-containing protein [Lachnospiraceae bacterium]
MEYKDIISIQQIKNINVQNAALSYYTFQRGKSLFQSGRARVTSAEQFWKTETVVGGEVKDETATYHLQLRFSKDKVIQCNCSCGEGKSYLCSHGVALVLVLQSMQDGEWINSVKSSKEGLNITEYYADKKYQSAVLQQNMEPVHIVPKIIGESNQRISVEFQIGRDRVYVIKNLSFFAQCMERGNIVEYGKKFTFQHQMSAFDEKGQKFVQFIMESYVHNGYVLSTYYNSYARQDRCMILDRWKADKFFDIVGMQPLEAEWMGSKQIFQVVEGNPNLQLKIIQQGRDGVQIGIFEKFACVAGLRHCYVFYENKIYVCDTQYSEACGIFLQELTHMGSSDEESSYLLNHKDLPAFCSEVIPYLEPYLDVVTEQIDLEKFKPDPLLATFYLDLEEENQVECRVQFRYGEVEFNPMSQKLSPKVKSIYRDEVGETKIRNVLSNYFGETDLKGILRNDGTEDSLFRFLEEGVPALQACGEVLYSESFKNLKIDRTPNISVGISLDSDLLNLTLDAGGMTPQELMELWNQYRRKKKYFRLKNGDFLRLEENSMQALDQLIGGLHLSQKDLSGDSITVPKYRSIYVDQVLKDNGQISVYRDKKFKSMIRTMKSVEDSEFDVPESLKNVLRSYQKVGYRWMKTLKSYGFGGILADDMGLGKTIQVIALLLSEQQEGKTSIVICPASLVYNWKNEVERFGSTLKAVTVTGSESERKEILSHASDYDVLITSYDLQRRDKTLYKKCHFLFEIIDEAQYIKNHSTQTAKAVKEIVSDYRFALTGTPIENRLSELWSIFDYLMPGYLYPYTYFRSNFETPIVKSNDGEALKKLNYLAKPFILRRLKGDVLRDLPEKDEQVVMARLEGTQNQLYAAAVMQLKDSLEKATEESFNTGKLQVLAALTRLRQICCHPALCLENYDKESAKLDTCLGLIEQAIDGGHRILLFSQFTSMLELIEEELNQRNIAYCKLTGATSKEERAMLVRKFQNENIPIFLISLKAGGTGLNLTAADIVIHYDPWWNVAAQNQATDRTHRIGQTRAVTVYKLIAKNTIEEKILQLQDRKKELADQILTGEGANIGAMSKDEILALLS